MGNYFKSFRLRTHLEVNNIRATAVLNKNWLRKYTTARDKQLQKKRNVATLNKTAHIKQISSLACVVVRTTAGRFM